MANIIFIFCIVVKCIKNIDTILFDMIFQKARMQITVSLTSSKNAVNFIHRNIFPNSGRRLNLPKIYQKVLQTYNINCYLNFRFVFFFKIKTVKKSIKTQKNLIFSNFVSFYYKFI